MIRFQRLHLWQWSQIIISGIRCTSVNIRKIVDALNFDYVGINIYTLPLKSTFLSYLVEKKIDFVSSKKSEEVIDVSLKVHRDLIDFILNQLEDRDPEIIMIYNLKECSDWKGQINIDLETLISTEIIDIGICITCDENTILVMAHNNTYNVKELYKKLKAFNYEK